MAAASVAVSSAVLGPVSRLCQDSAIQLWRNTWSTAQHPQKDAFAHVSLSFVLLSNCVCFDKDKRPN